MRAGRFLLGVLFLTAAVFAGGHAVMLVGTEDFGNGRLAMTLAGIAVAGLWAGWLCLVDRK